MARHFSKRIVVDASVAKRCGSTQNPAHENTRACRHALIEMLEICHRAVVSEDVLEEWRRHAGSFFLQWRVNMVSRNKIEHLVYAPNENLMEELLSAIDSERKRKEVRKDIHLISLALESDKCVLSVDESMRRLLVECARSVKSLRAISWVNPETEPGKAIRWLREGARSRSEFRIHHGQVQK